MLAGSRWSGSRGEFIGRVRGRNRLQFADDGPWIPARDLYEQACAQARSGLGILRAQQPGAGESGVGQAAAQGQTSPHDPRQQAAMTQQRKECQERARAVADRVQYGAGLCAR